MYGLKACPKKRKWTNEKWAKVYDETYVIEEKGHIIIPKAKETRRGIKDI
jgi:hypothetical protein